MLVELVNCVLLCLIYIKDCHISVSSKQQLSIALLRGTWTAAGAHGLLLLVLL